MKVLGKVLLGVVSILVVALGGLAGYVAYVFDPNAYRADIERQARESVGIELHIKGDIGLSFFPWLAVEIGDIDMNLPDQTAFARLEQARAAINIPALLSGAVQIDRILIDGVTLNLAIDKNGTGNWEPLMARAGAEDGSGDRVQGAAEKAPETPSMQLAVAGFEMRDATIHYRDEATEQQVALKGLNLTIDQFALGEATPIQLDMQLVTQMADAESLALPIKAEAEMVLNLEAQTLDLSAVKLDLGAMTARASLTLSGFDTPRFNGSFAIPTQAPARMLAPLGVELPILGETAFTRFGLTTQVSGALDVVRLSQLEITFDDTTLSGQTAYFMDTAQLELTLKGDAINLDHYMTPAEDELPDDSAEAAPKGQKGWSKEELLPALPLSDLNAEIVFQLARAELTGQKISDIAIKASVKDGVASVTELAANAFGGSLTSTAQLDARAAKPIIRVSSKLRNVQAEQLMAMVMDDPILAAQINMTADIGTSGASAHDFVHALNGSAKMEAAEGVLKGIDMAQQLCRDPRTVAEFGFRPSATGLTTAAAGMNASFRIKDGVIRNPTFKISVDAAHFTAKGMVDLPQRAFDYNLGLTLANDLFDESCGINPVFKGRRIPVECAGTFDTDPAKLCALDTGFIEDIIKEEAAKKLKKEAAKAQAKLQEKAKQKLETELKNRLGDALNGQDPGDVLKGLFGR